MEKLTIGQLAKKVNVNLETIRYYEKLALIEPVKRDLNGYRIYSDQVVDQLMYIKIGKGLGFTLAEIKVLLHDDLYRTSLNAVKEVVNNKIDELEGEIDKMKIKLSLLNGINDKIGVVGDLDCKQIDLK